MTDLRQVRLLAAQYAEAERDLRTAVRAAREAGDSVADIATAALVTRQTIYRWTSMDDDRVNVRDTISDALVLLSGLVSHEIAGQLSRRIGHKEIPVLLLGLRMGTANLMPSASSGVTTEELLLLGQAQIAADAATRHHARTGRWPEMVTLDPPSSRKPMY